ncbi:MAG: glutamate--tRNA ligase, partial [Omnitrophica WOR_2 bacterium RBG_13_44_8b]
MTNTDKVRVRFAPSPTGYLHLGSARTALFNWLYARHTNGKLVLRIEDTDKERSRKEFLDEILEDLKWLGIDWDEGPFCQSQKISIYKEYAARLLDKNLAYKEGDAIIFKVEKSKVIKINDIVHGEIIFNTDELKDQVLIKSDGLPAYNFACVVDDSEMAITHIIRGDDHISNTPKQLLFYEALGINPPEFAHMPLMMGKDGAKLSKRHGAVAVFEYKKEGFLPEALSNYLLLLGWSPGDGKEIMPLREAQKIFDIKDLSDVQAKFDIDKLRWINGEYIKNEETKVLARLIRDSHNISADAQDGYLINVIDLYKTRFRTINEFANLTECFFTDDFTVDEDARKKLDKYLKD